MQNRLGKTGSSALAGDGGGAWAVHAAEMLRSELPRLRYALIEVKLENLLGRLAPAIGRKAPPLNRWPRARDGLLEIPTLASLKSNVAELRFQLVLCQFAWRERKAGFDPNQPRVPRGQPDGGQWTDGGGGGGSDGDTGSGGSGRAPLRITIHPRSSYETEGTSSQPPLGDPPRVPEVEPESRHALNEFAKQAAWWAAKALARELANPLVGSLLDGIDLAYWGYKAAPYVRAYLDPPKPLDELQRAATNPATGYDIHHIVEKQAAKDAKYPNQMIEGPDNLVRIPTLKHWQISGWYMTRNDKYGWLSPREYLSGKDWTERTRVGLEALAKFEVLKP